MKPISIILFISVFLFSCDTDPQDGITDDFSYIFSDIYTFHNTGSIHLTDDRPPATGTFTDYFDDGDVRGELTLKDGVILSGSILHDNREAWIEFATDDELRTITTYLEDGTLVRKVVDNLSTDRLITSKEWYYDGTPKSEFSETVIRSWYPNGIVKEEAHFKDRMLHGKVAKWHESGQLAGETQYVDNEIHGSYIEWDEAGNIITEKKYEMGKLVYERDI